ncbi:MAG: DUF1285 domain-containing protein [Pseudomonadota bacterium]
MSDTKTPEQSPLERLEALLKATRGEKLPPVHKWDPPARPDIGLAISYDGSWSYQGDRIERGELVRLFSTVLRREVDGGYFLVTPVEKVPVTVEETPFVVVEMQIRSAGPEQDVLLRTSVDDVIAVSPVHPIRFVAEPPDGGLKPIVHVRDRLEARVNRPVYYELVEACSVTPHEGEDHFGLWSSGTFFAMARAADIPGLMEDEDT